MMVDFSHYLDSEGENVITETERCKALMYFRRAETGTADVTMEELLTDINDTGFNRPNTSRLVKKLNSDRDLTKGIRPKSWRFTNAGYKAYEKVYGQRLRVKPIPETNSVLPLTIVANTRGYIETITKQINACYDIGCFDAALVMIRKLLEACLIEAFLKMRMRPLIIKSDGNYYFLSGLIKAALNNNPLALSRNSMGFLRERNPKRRGDLAAHNPRFVAIQKDIDDIKDDLRVIIQELILILGISK